MESTKPWISIDKMKLEVITICDRNDLFLKGPYPIAIHKKIKDLNMQNRLSLSPDSWLVFVGNHCLRNRFEK